jgi:hypothetical protein
VIVFGKRSLTADAALRLVHYFGSLLYGVFIINPIIIARLLLSIR